MTEREQTLARDSLMRRIEAQPDGLFRIGNGSIFFSQGEIDPPGMVNVVIAPNVYTRDRAALQGAFVLIDGILQKDHKAINVVAKAIRSI